MISVRDWSDFQVVNASSTSSEARSGAPHSFLSSAIQEEISGRHPQVSSRSDPSPLAGNSCYTLCLLSSHDLSSHDLSSHERQ
jgi:hypothetical protein